MSDIVERLRAQADWTGYENIREAADLIERLRQENAEMRKLLNKLAASGSPRP